MAEIKEKKAVYEILFGVHFHEGNLFSAKIVKMKDGKVSEWKHGTETSLGHAVTIAEDLMGAYAVQAIEQSPEKFYDEVTVI